MTKELLQNSTLRPEPARSLRAKDDAARSFGSRRWAVVGGGMLGMTLALRLAEAGKSVTLFESASELGGLASAWSLGDIVWDRHYHVTLLSDTYTRGLADELGLGAEFDWVNTRTGFYTDGQLLSMSNTVEFLRFPPLNLLEKLRLGATIFYASRIKRWQRLERVPVSRWLSRWSGKRTFEKIWLPLLRSKLGESYRDVSAAFIWATIARMYAARRTGLKREMFGYVRGGYARILERFAETLRAKGVEIRCGQAVKSVEAIDACAKVSQEDSGLRLEFADGNCYKFDEVVLTLPAPVAARVSNCLSGDERERLAGVRYQGIICASLLIKKPLSNFYVTNITDGDVPFTAVIEMSALVDREAFGGNALVYLPKYVASDDAAFSLSDEELRAQFLQALARMYPAFDAERDVLCFQVSRVRNVFPLPVLNYSGRMPPMQTSVAGLHIINSAHITNGTLNVNETLKLAERAAASLLCNESVDAEPVASSATAAINERRAGGWERTSART
ncbi:MAG TPA: NAD(P)/FAD-dependent oxidoreductase [Pyrinomonadaceae bacterium]|nr:NAD(P)/FAD-dependent oxidoreductase [Pyrinomonadaceae bacterium]